MVSLRKLKKLFTVHMYPRKTGDELIVCQRMDKILRERSITSKPFRVKYIGCRLIVSPTLPPEKASEVAKAIVKRGPRRNKRRVSLIITPEESFVMDTTYRCGLASFLMEEIGMTYAPEGSKLFGVTVKDWATSGYLFLLYKCTVRDFPCENVEILNGYQNMREEYLKIRSTAPEIAHVMEESPDELQVCDKENAVVSAGTLKLKSHDLSSAAPTSSSLTLLPSLKLPFPPTAPVTITEGSMASFLFCSTTFDMKLVYSFIDGPIFSLSGTTLLFSPLSLILSPFIPLQTSPLSITDSTTSLATSTADSTTSSLASSDSIGTSLVAFIRDCTRSYLATSVTTATSTTDSTTLSSTAISFTDSPPFTSTHDPVSPVLDTLEVLSMTSDLCSTTSTATTISLTDSDPTQHSNPVTSTGPSTSTTTSLVVTSAASADSSANSTVTTSLPTTLSTPLTTPVTVPVSPATSNTATATPVTSLSNSFYFPSSVSLTGTIAPARPRMDRKATPSPLYDSISPEVEYSFADLESCDLSSPPFPSPCATPSPSISSPSLEPLLQAQSAPLLHEMAGQPQTPHSHSLPVMPLSQPFPSPLLQSVLSTLFIFASGPNSLAPTHPHEHKPVPQESVWASARLSFYSQTEGEGEEDMETVDMREESVENKEFVTEGKSAESENEEDMDTVEMRRKRLKDKEIDTEEKSVAESEEMVEDLIQFSSSSESEDEEESVEMETQEEDKQLDKQRSDDDDDDDSEDEEMTDEDSDKNEFSSATPPQPTLMDLARVWNSRPQRPRKRISPHILNLIKQIEASLVQPDDNDGNCESDEESEDESSLSDSVVTESLSGSAMTDDDGICESYKEFEGENLF